MSTILWLLGFPHMSLVVPVGWEGHEIVVPVCDDVVCARRTCYWICELHVSLAVPACELWSSVPGLDYSSLDAGYFLEILRTSQQSPGWIVSPVH
ncbi:unnamed protein product [Prunus armeniaca]